jgi:dipeptidyl aminopeptidase/acylaminoacyl peptidase
VLQLLELSLKEYPKIDPDRVYCTGLSMGGFGTYNLATEHPEFFAAVCCVSGTGDPAKAEKLRNVPLLILQGGADRVVPQAGAEKVAARMKELGYVVDLNIFPKYGHDYRAEEYLDLSIDFFQKYTRKK